MNKFAFGTHDYRIYYVNIDLRHQYGISVAESQTFLLARRPSAAISKEKRLPLAGYILFTFGQICNFRDSNLVTFYFYEFTHFMD